MEHMTYAKLLKNMLCDCLVIFEDDFGYEEKDYKASVLFNLIRMNRRDRDLFLDDVRGSSMNLYEELTKICASFDPYIDSIDDWENIVRNDVKGAINYLDVEGDIKEQLIKLYDSIEESDLENIKSAAGRYGLGIFYPTEYEKLFQEYLWASSVYPSLRVYRDFGSNEKECFSKDISLLDDEKSIICILDNNLNGTDKAPTIIDFIKENCKDGRKNIIGSVFSSKSSFEKIDEHIYFEFTSKSTIEDLRGCLARSCYSYFIQGLRNNTLEKIDGAFKSILSNKNLAHYLAVKASVEGESEYNVINDLLRLLCKPTKESEASIVKLVKAAHIINEIESYAGNADYYDTSLEVYNTYEAFDYSVNTFLQPPTAGDIFTDGTNYYVLIGQDCDMSWRGNGTEPRNITFELLPASLIKQVNFDKWVSDQKCVNIYNFKEKIDDEENNILSIDYQKRKFISNEILNLCAFNPDGQCRIAKSAQLEESVLELLPRFLTDYYKRLQVYYSSLLKLKANMPDEFELIVNGKEDNYLLRFSDLEETDSDIIYTFHRVCRLDHEYVYYLYRLFLEYRGRQPFQTINLVGQRNITLPVYYDNATEKNITFTCIEREKGRSISTMPWIIEVKKLTEILEPLGISWKGEDRKIILYKDKEDYEVEIKAKKKPRTLRIIKKQNKVQLQLV